MTKKATKEAQEFAASGIEADKSDTSDAPDSSETPVVEEQADPSEAPAVEEQAAPVNETASYVVTHRDGVLKKIYFRDGKEIGSEDV